MTLILLCKSQMEAIGAAVLRTIFGLAIAVVAGFFLWLELKDGVAAAHTTHIYIFTAFFGVGLGIVAPELFFGSVKRGILILIDAKAGGLRFTDRLLDDAPAATATTAAANAEKKAGESAP